MPKTAPSQTPKPTLVEPVLFRLGTRERRQIHLLVELASGCRKRLGLGEYRDRGERATIAQILEGVTWALDKLGYPPARYEEVLREYAPVETRERRKSRPARRPKPEADPEPEHPDPAESRQDVPEKGWIR